MRERQLRTFRFQQTNSPVDIVLDDVDLSLVPPAELVREPIGDRLIFGSHAPLFIPYSAVARVVLDLDDAAAGRVLSGNSGRLLP